MLHPKHFRSFNFRQVATQRMQTSSATHACFQRLSLYCTCQAWPETQFPFDQPFYKYMEQASISTLFLRGDPEQIPSQEVQQDITACSSLLTGLQTNMQQLLKKINTLKESVEEMSVEKGIGYFDAKNLVALEYLIQLHFYIGFKLEGVDLANGEGFELYKQLIYLKTLLGKLAPLDKKLDYRVSKVLREGLAKEEANNFRTPIISEDTLKYKPHPENLNKERTTENLDKKEKKYVVPKLASTLMNKDQQSRKKQLREERRKAYLRRQLRDVITEGEHPEDINMGSLHDQKMLKNQKEKQQYELENFVRLPESKKERQLRKKAEKNLYKDDVGDLRDLDKIDELLRYEKLIEEDYEKEQKLQKTLGLRKKIKKRS